jgi:hypothetical protein
MLNTLFFVLLFCRFAHAQDDGEMTKLLDYSRPGKEHAALGQLAGNWNFQDTKLAFVKGALVRKAIFNGRFYSVEVTGGKLPVPVANGQMKEENYQSLLTEGFDNAQHMFFTTSINNHIGSDIQYQSGKYDDAKKQWTYEWESVLLPGQKTQNRRVVTITDSSHYIEEYYEINNGKAEKVRELDYTRN